jgi:hypothetical protein
MNTFQPKIFRLNYKSQWLEGQDVRKRTLFSQKYSLQNKKILQSIYRNNIIGTGIVGD